MKTTDVTIETPLTPKELFDKLRSMTITNFSQLHEVPTADYYGEVDNFSFDIMNVHYGPMSSVPSIQGEIEEGINKTTINIKMDIERHYKLARNMYYSTLFPIGAIVLLLSFLVLGGTDYQLHGFIFSGSFMACAVLVVILTKTSLLTTKRRELKNFAAKINGIIKIN